MFVGIFERITQITDKGSNTPVIRLEPTIPLSWGMHGENVKFGGALPWCK